MQTGTKIGVISIIVGIGFGLPGVFVISGIVEIPDKINDKVYDDSVYVNYDWGLQVEIPESNDIKFKEQIELSEISTEFPEISIPLAFFYEDKDDINSIKWNLTIFGFEYYGLDISESISSLKETTVQRFQEKTTTEDMLFVSEIIDNNDGSFSFFLDYYDCWTINSSLCKLEKQDIVFYPTSDGRLIFVVIRGTAMLYQSSDGPPEIDPIFQKILESITIFDS